MFSLVSYLPVRCTMHVHLQSYYDYTLSYTGYWLQHLFDRLNAVTASFNNHEELYFSLAISEI